MKTAWLDAGFEVAYLNRLELDFLVAEIFEKEVYLAHGITLEPGSCVFDVGANIGLFSLFAEAVAPGVRLFAFEPLPEPFAVLSANARRYFPSARLYACGLAEKIGAASFRYYPRCSGWSTRYPEVPTLKADLYTYVRRNWFAGAPLPRPLFNWAVQPFLQEQVVSCPLATLSAILDQEHLPGIDLLKIDAERSELDILRGIAPRHWPGIRQIVLETERAGGHLDAICALLADQGYRLTVTQQPDLQGSGYYLVYALRS